MYDFWKKLSNEEKTKFASMCESSVGYLRLIFSGHKKAGYKMCNLIEKNSNGQVRKSELRPDIYSVGGSNAENTQHTDA
ncbi:TPA: transcriptional regulator [Providencia rettgeri]